MLETYMLPVLLDLKFVKIYTFGIFLVLAFFWSSFLLWKNIRLTSYKEEDVFDGMFLSLLGALFVGRLIYVLQHFDKFGLNIGKFILINGYPGLVLYGCLAGALLSYAIYTATHKMNFFDIMDYIASPALLAIAIGKLGAFFAGTEIGTRTKLFAAIRYANAEGLRHLTPLYESILFFIGAYLAYHVMFSVRRQKYKRGFSLYFFFWYFSFVYLILDRIKNTRYYIGGFSFNEALSAVLLTAMSLYMLYYFRHMIGRPFAAIRNSALKHGKKTKQTVHRRPEEETGGGEEENTETDPGSQEE